MIVGGYMALTSQRKESSVWPTFGGLEPFEFQLDGDQAAQVAVEKEQVEVRWKLSLPAVIRFCRAMNVKPCPSSRSTPSNSPRMALSKSRSLNAPLTLSRTRRCGSDRGS